MVDLWGKILAPQPWIETHLKFYYQLQQPSTSRSPKVLDALAASTAYETTIVFSYAVLASSASSTLVICSSTVACSW